MICHMQCQLPKHACACDKNWSTVPTAEQHITVMILICRDCIGFHVFRIISEGADEAAAVCR